MPNDQITNFFRGLKEALDRIHDGITNLQNGLQLLNTPEGRARVISKLEADGNYSAMDVLKAGVDIVDAAVAVAASDNAEQ